MDENLLKIDKLLVANRSEIAIRILRAASELNIRTVAVYTYEDRYSQHRYKADEAYQIGDPEEALRPYLDIEEIIQLAKRKNVDAIHPGYGFLSENTDFARRCKEEGIIFVGPTPEAMAQLGDKVDAKRLARKLKIPVIEDSTVDLSSNSVAVAEANKIGYPIMVKAAAGGGGRGMRVVRNDQELSQYIVEARNEASRAFGSDVVFLEKYIENPKHVEVQILADTHGSVVHLYERDCSVQRRFQKLVEVAPCSNISQTTKDSLFNYALKIAKAVNYANAGTVEFLIDQNENVYFIEVNPRIQVEHTVTEQITGVDIVRSQILVAKGHKLSDDCIALNSQSDVKCEGFAIQCRITTEDPENDFLPDYGKITAYRSPGGFGIRLDAGNAYPGVSISPSFDSLLVKVTASGRTLVGATERLHRALQEFRIRGVKTNIPFLENVVTNEKFRAGQTTVGFILQNPDLFDFVPRRDRATKVLRYLGEVCVNGNPDVKQVDKSKNLITPKVPAFKKYEAYPEGTKQKLTELGPEKFSKWLKDQKSIQYTDTTFRDAHQSLLATRVRTIDMIRVAESFAKNHPNVFSMEVWGGATFDVSMRFLHECPWERLQLLRAAIPNILLQMLIRSSNAVGYTAYPDNLVGEFIEKSWDNGIDIFRIFDSMNWFDAMKYSIKAVRERTGALAEASICYTSDLENPNETVYTLQYYLDLARRLEDEGAHILAIKDMAGLLKPYAATKLVAALKDSISIPIHLHTHDTSSIQSATYLNAIEAGVDVVDVALASMSGLTSQPNFNSIVAMLNGHERELPLNFESLNDFSNYWELIREFYYPFESGLKAGTGEIYVHEIPGGQYSNLKPQARSLGLEEKFDQIKKNYTQVNKMLGNIVKVTPSSKVVGDLALYMTSNNLSVADIVERGEELSFPESLQSYFRGSLGQPHVGFPKDIQKIVLKDEQPFTTRPNEHLEPIDFDSEFEQFKSDFDTNCSFLDFISYKFYPKVFRNFYEFRKTYGRVTPIPTPAFFYGLENDEEILVEITEGKTLIIRKLYTGEANEEGSRTVFFKLNGNTRGVEVQDASQKVTKVSHKKASAANEIGSPLQGKLSTILVSAGESVEKNQPLFIIEAMKMETTVTATAPGVISSIELREGTLVESDDLILSLEA